MFLFLNFGSIEESYINLVNEVKKNLMPAIPNFGVQNSFLAYDENKNRGVSFHHSLVVYLMSM